MPGPDAGMAEHAPSQGQMVVVPSSLDDIDKPQKDTDQSGEDDGCCKQHANAPFYET